MAKGPASAGDDKEFFLKYQELLEHSNDGVARCRMIFEDEVPVDFIYLEVNHRFEELTGLRDVIGKRVSEVIPGIRQKDPELFELYGEVARAKRPTKFELYVKSLANWFSVSAFSSEEGVFTAIFEVITERKRVEGALARSRQEFADLVNNSPNGVARLDLDAKYVFANKRIAEMRGCRPEDLIGQYVGSITGDPVPSIEVVKRVIATGRAEAHVHVSPPSAAAPVFTRNQFVPERSPEGTVQSVLMITTDLTDLQRAEKLAEERGSIIDALFETAAQGIVAVGPDGKIQLINRMAEQMFGYEPGELLNARQDVLLPEHLRQVHAADRESFMAAPKNRPMGLGMDLAGRRKDGSLFPVEVSLSHLNSSKGLLGVSFVTDITVRKQQEEELRTLRGRLLAAEEDIARGLARELHDDVTQRLAFLSMEIGKAAIDPVPQDVLTEKLSGLQKRIQDLSEMIRGISHRMHPSVLDDLGLSDALEQLCMDTEEAGNATVHFESRGVPDRIDRTVASGLYRVCQVCMSNILKHARADSVTVRLEVERGTLQMTIIDTGVGFDPGLTKNGVGTYSMKERVRLLNGKLSIESEPGKGTRVVVNVPLDGPSVMK